MKKMSNDTKITPESADDIIINNNLAQGKQMNTDEEKNLM